MKRIARNTTAIVTCLSMLMPSFAMAQQSGDGGVAQSVFEDLQKQSEKDKEEAKRQSEAQKKKKKEQKARAEKQRREAEKAREAKKQAAERERERRKKRKEAQREERREEQAAKARREESQKREEAKRKQSQQEARKEEKAAQERREERREREEARRERREDARQEAREEQARRAERARKEDEADRQRRDERRRARNAAAREAAEATRAPEAAALSALLGSGNVFRQQITDENSRSSDEDFATSLRDALSNDRDRDRWRRESRWREEERKRWEERNRDRDNNDDDDDNDLTKVLLLGLGALAVGSMLNNNRQVALSSPDRVVVTRPDGSQELIKDDAALLRQPGSNVETEQFDDGSSRTIVTRADGSKVVTIRDADMRILRRTLISPDGRTSQLIDDTRDVQPVDIASLPPAPAPVGLGNAMDEEALRAALNREANIDRRFTLGQIRNIHEVRSLVAPVDIPAITFDTGSAAVPPGQAQQLSALGRVLEESIRENPQEIYMIEGYTDTVGDPAMNLALSDRRAESVALALTEYFDVPPENLVVQGYGEDYLKVAEEGDIRSNRRSSVRRITDLLQTAAPE